MAARIRRWKGWLRTKRTGLLAVALLLGCSARDSAPMQAESQSDGSATATEAGPPAVQNDPDANRRYVVREAEMRLRTTDPRRVADRAARLAAAADGFVLDSDVRSVDARASEVELNLRIPHAKLEAVLGQLRGLGEVLVEKVSGRDVTEEFVDVAARMRAERGLETRLLALLDTTAALKDLLLVEQELARVRAAIEQKEGRLRYLTARTDMAAIRLIAEAPEQPFVASSQSIASRFGNAFRRALELALAVTEGLISALGFALPLLGLGLPFALLGRWWRKRRFAIRQPAGNV